MWAVFDFFPQFFWSIFERIRTGLHTSSVGASFLFLSANCHRAFEIGSSFRAIEFTKFILCSREKFSDSFSAEEECRWSLGGNDNYMCFKGDLESLERTAQVLRARRRFFFFLGLVENSRASFRLAVMRSRWIGEFLSFFFLPRNLKNPVTLSKFMVQFKDYGLHWFTGVILFTEGGQFVYIASLPQLEFGFWFTKKRIHKLQVSIVSATIIPLSQLSLSNLLQDRHKFFDSTVLHGVIRSLGVGSLSILSDERNGETAQCPKNL